jgi:SAM-dependent methyltransferase
MGPLKRYSTDGVHERVLECMDGLPRGLVLDAPSGMGALSKDLEKLGFKVVLGDIERKNIFYQNGRCIQLDLNVSFPFKDDIFDYVFCVEGIEHIENPHLLIREFARVVKRGGSLIVSTPNVMTIKSRLRFLFYSYLDFFRYFGPLPLEEKHKIDEYEHQHLNPVSYSEMKFILERYGFKIEKVETNRKVRKWNIIFPLIKWFVKYKTRKKFPRDPLFVSDVILEGEDLIFIAKYGLESFPRC